MYKESKIAVCFPEQAFSASVPYSCCVQDIGTIILETRYNATEDAAIEGLKSKTHMKVLLKWRWGRQIIKLSCTQAGNTKNFLYSPFTADANSQGGCRGGGGVGATAAASEERLEREAPKYKAQAKKQQTRRSGLTLVAGLFYFADVVSSLRRRTSS